jgi:hypothetical protein
MQTFQISFATTVRNGFGLIAVTLSLAVAVPACATTWKVTSNADDGTPHTLRSALANANNGDTILMSGDLKVPIVLTRGDIVVNHNVTVTTATARMPTISGNNNSRLLKIIGATVTLNNLNFTNGNGVSNNPNGDTSWDGFGGAVLVDVGGALNVSNCSFTQNQCSQGGAAIELVGNSLTVRKSTFVGGDAYYGTAIDDENPSGTDTMNLTECSFVNNGGLLTLPNNVGGVITPYFGTYNFSHCEFRDNSEGVIANFGGTITVTGCILSGNSSTRNGGAIDNYSGTMTVTDCILSGNSGYDGGAIRNEEDGGATMTVSGCILSGNSATFTGGAIDNSVGAMTVTDCILYANSAAFDGGGIDNNYGTITVTGCTLSNNSAAFDGGGIFNGVGGGPVFVGGSVFRGNLPDAIAGPSGYIDQGGNTFH